MSRSDEATLANWRTTPYSRWAFHHVDRLLPVETIAHDPASASPLQRASTQLDDSFLQTLFLRATATDAVVVLIEGAVAYEYYANGNDERTPHIAMSATKAVVGLLAEILQHDGAVDLDAMVTSFVPEVGESPFRSVTLRQLLDMRSGVMLSVEQERAYALAGGWDPPHDGERRPTLHEFFTELRSEKVTPGGAFRYVSANTDLAGWALERAAGRSIAALISERIWKPIGAEQAAYITTDAAGSPRCTGGMCATARDLARLGRAVAASGRGGVHDVMPAHVVEEICSGGDFEAWREGEWGASFAPLSKAMRYRSGWYSMDDRGWLFAMGIHGQNLFIDRVRDIVVAKYSSWKEPTDYVALPLTHIGVGRLRRALDGSASSKEP